MTQLFCQQNILRHQEFEIADLVSKRVCTGWSMVTASESQTHKVDFFGHILGLYPPYQDEKLFAYRTQDVLLGYDQLGKRLILR